MATTIEARAVITAEDKTKGVFDAIAKKFAALGKGAKISKEIDATTRAIGDAEKKLKSIAQMQTSEKIFARAEAKLQSAKTAHDAAARAAASAVVPSKKLQDQTERTRQAVERSTAAFERQHTAVLAARHAVSRGGIGLSNIEGEQRKLRAMVGAGSAALERQVAGRMPGGGRQPVRAASSGGGLVPPIGMRVLGPAALAYAAGRSFTSYADADRRMTRIGITADASQAEMRDVQREAQELAGKNALPYEKIVEGYDTLAAQGREMKAIRAFMPSIAMTAQASGSEVADIAKTADTVETSFKVRDMQKAFDYMVTGGKLGQFELKDQARYLPSLGPAASAIGFSGEKGLADLVSLLQVVRKGSGTVEEAVSSVNNILAKMESDKTIKGLKEKGIDAKKEYEQARKEGRNLVDVFEDMVQRAVKGDRSKLGDIIDDMEFKRGVQALMTYRGERQKLANEIERTASGASQRDLDRVLSGPQARIDRMAASFNAAKTSAGEFISIFATPALDAIGGKFAGLTAAVDEFQRKIAESPPPAKPNEASPEVRRLNGTFGAPEGALGVIGRALAASDEEHRGRLIREKRGALGADLLDLDTTLTQAESRDKRRREEISLQIQARRKQLDNVRRNRPGLVDAPFGQKLQTEIDEMEADRSNVGQGETARIRKEFAAKRAELEELNRVVDEFDAAKKRLGEMEEARKAVRETPFDKPGQGRFADGRGRAFGFGPGGSGVPGGNPWDEGGASSRVPLPPVRPSSTVPPSVSDILGNATIEAKVTEAVPVNISFSPWAPTITVKVDGPGTVTNTTYGAPQPHASTGTSMPGATVRSQGSYAPGGA